ncbi:hypothetical protein CTA1_2626 [Colletotrichum tanaceti]|uniref:Uncharacterized protein n=1 Tax=Colletotrichum tanaceti TaxID=1306861 RepID=A0A4U6X629_9PEZI|nr:hypothetical protein CTA1_2626 [Colletotrichum tanaceti]
MVRTPPPATTPGRCWKCWRRMMYPDSSSEAGSFYLPSSKDGDAAQYLREAENIADIAGPTSRDEKTPDQQLRIQCFARVTANLTLLEPLSVVRQDGCRLDFCAHQKEIVMPPSNHCKSSVNQLFMPVAQNRINIQSLLRLIAFLRQIVCEQLRQQTRILLLHVEQIVGLGQGCP